MSFNISAVAIRNPIPPIILFVLLTIVGVASFLSLDITNNPDLDFPIVNVSVSRPGAAPSEIELQVTRKIEDAVAGLGNIDHIQSTVKDGQSVTSIEFALGSNTDRAVNDVRDAVSKIRQNLPQDIYEPVVERLDVSGDAILYYSVVAPQLSTEELSWLIDNEISRTMLSVPGVAQVRRIGGVDREVRVELDPARLMALGVTAVDVNNQLFNLNVDVPGGRGTIGSAEQTIRTLGSARTVDDLRNTEISLPSGNAAVPGGTVAVSGGNQARLSEIGRIMDGASEQRQAGRFDGKPVVSFSILRSPNTSEVTIAKGVERKLAELRARHPDIEFKQIFSMVTYTQESYDASIETMLIGAILAVLVVWWFLRDGRATVISAIAMPLSILPTFAAMKLMGFTLNGITMLALSLVVGILVDDAIVEIENIVRHIRGGKRPYLAALEAADEIGLAVVATTMTIVVVFLPVSAMPGIPGQYFRQFGITVAVAVLFSLLVARLLTPLMAAYFLKGHPEPSPARWLAQYGRLLAWSLGHRRATIGIGIGIFAASLALVPFIPSGFLPTQDSSRSTLQVELPPGATLADTDAVTSRVSALLRQQPEVEHVLVSIGGQGEVRRANIFVSLKPKGERTRSQKEFELAMREPLLAIPGMRFGFNASSGFGNKDVSVILAGDDGALLERTAEQVIREIRGLDGVLNVSSSSSLLRPELLIRPDFDRAAELGVSVQAIGHVALLATLGDLDQNLAKFNMGDRQIPIRVQLAPEAREDVETIENLRVSTSTGATVPLKSVASVSIGAGSVQIDRFDRSRKIEITGDLNRGAVIGPVLKQIYNLPTMRHLPDGVTLQKYGTSEQMGVLMRGFGFALGAAVLLIFAVLALLFKSFIQPPTIMVALPLSIGGALTALLFANMSLSLPALIGIMMLMGIVTKNSILLVEYAIVAMRERGLDRRAALIDAGAKRARPILMTTIAMIAGMVPIAIGWGADADFRAPMAVAVIGGLVTSTLLSLVFIPVVFTYMDDFGHWLSPRLSRLVTHRGDHARPHGTGGDVVPYPRPLGAE